MEEDLSEKQINAILDKIRNQEKVHLVTRRGASQAHLTLTFYREMGTSWLAYDDRGEMMVLIFSPEVMDACRGAMGIPDRKSDMTGMLWNGCNHGYASREERGKGQPVTEWGRYCEFYTWGRLREFVNGLMTQACVLGDEEAKAFAIGMRSIDGECGGQDHAESDAYDFDSLHRYYRKGMSVVVETAIGPLTGMLCEINSQRDERGTSHKVKVLMYCALRGNLEPLVITVRIPEFVGKRHPRDLPCRMIGAEAERQAYDSKTLAALCSGTPLYVRYSGTALMPMADGRVMAERMSGSVVIDPKASPLSMGAENADIMRLLGAAPADEASLDLARSLGLLPPSVSSDGTTVTSAEWMVCPVSHAYALADKSWVMVDVRNAERIHPGAAFPDTIPIGEKERDALLAVCERWSCSRQGAAFLLRGAPGIGKTFTVERMASHLGVPIYRASMREMGSRPREMEDCLMEAMRRCERWGALLLLDEADSLIERRESGRQDRNDVVSTLLKAMDRFGGILFLTTNRISHIDSALASRITMQIMYSRPDSRGRSVIWEDLLSSAGYPHIDAHRLAKHDIDVRQAKSAVTVGTAIAARRGDRLGHEHIEEAIELCVK